MDPTRPEAQKQASANTTGDPDDAPEAAPGTLVGVADLEESAVALCMLARELAWHANFLVHVPPEHAQEAIEGVNEMLWFGNMQRSIAAKRLALLLCIDAVVAEQEHGTGLGQLLVEHFPEVGGEADRRKLEDRRTQEYRAFAEDWTRWAYRGNAADIGAYRSIATMAVLERLVARRETLKHDTRQSVEPIRGWSSGQAAFAVTACLHVPHPDVGARALAARDQVVAVIDRWRPRVRDRWKSVASLCTQVGIVAKTETIRVQWETHKGRLSGDPIGVVAPLPWPPAQTPKE